MPIFKTFTEPTLSFYPRVWTSALRGTCRQILVERVLWGLAPGLPRVSAGFAFFFAYKQGVVQAQSVMLASIRRGDFRWDRGGIKSQGIPRGESYSLSVIFIKRRKFLFGDSKPFTHL